MPCRCLARTHLQGQQLDMCKGQSSRSSFVEAGRAVPFAADVVRFEMVKSVSAVASEWIRLQVSMGNQPTNQPASQPTNQPLKQSNCRSSESLPHAVPCTSTKTVRRPLQVLIRGGDNMQRWHCRTQQAEQQQPSPKPIHRPPPHPHTDMSCYWKGLRIMFL